MRHHVLALLAAGFFGILGTARAGPDAPQEKPFPTARTTIIRDTEVVYVVEGRSKIPAGVEITGQKGIHIRGKGREPVLEVHGSLVIHGVSGLDVLVTGVRIEPAKKVQQLHLDYCRFSAGGVATPPDKTTSGMITIENCDFDSSASLDLAVTAGKVKLMSVLTGPVVRLRGVDVGDKPNRVYGSIRTSKLNGLVVENIGDLTVRANVLKGSPLEFRDNRTLVFDGNRVEGGTLVLEHSEPGRFKKTKFTKCDLFCERIRFFAPAHPRKSDRVILDKCWFQGETDPKAIAKIVEDASDDPANNVRVTLKKPLKRLLGLAQD